MKTKTDKSAIAKFMGYEAVRIGYYGSDDETEWQVKNREWLGKPEIIEQYDNSVGDYFVNIEKNEIINQEDLDYANSWNDLMPVVEKIEHIDDYQVSIYTTWKYIGLKDGSRCRIQGGKIGNGILHTMGSKIEVTYKAVVEFIKWHQSQKS